jgi:hypothetical protein
MSCAYAEGTTATLHSIAHSPMRPMQGMVGMRPMRRIVRMADFVWERTGRALQGLTIVRLLSNERFVRRVCVGRARRGDPIFGLRTLVVKITLCVRTSYG